MTSSVYFSRRTPGFLHLCGGTCSYGFSCVVRLRLSRPAAAVGLKTSALGCITISNDLDGDTSHHITHYSTGDDQHIETDSDADTSRYIAPFVLITSALLLAQQFPPSISASPWLRPTSQSARVDCPLHGTHCTHCACHLGSV